MAISSELIQKLREKTGAGIMACKKALDETRGDFDKAVGFLSVQGATIAAKKSERVAKEGSVEAYIHGKGRIGVMVEVNCETDFVARNPEFIELVHDVAMQISAMNPVNVDELLSQEYIKDPSLTIKQLIESKVAKLGENIQIGRFTRYALGE
ncbi:MAG: translation elongation factor Ts [bacterium]|nr:translation elongation factor Ts [bacterium]